MCMQNLISNCHDTMISRYQIWHIDMMSSIYLFTKHHDIMFSADHYWSSYHLALDGWSLFTTCSVSNPHHYQNLGKAPNNVFCQFFRGHIFDDNIYVCTANFAANRTSQEIPCYQLSIFTFRYILLLKLPNAWQIVWGGETFCCIHLFLLRDLTNSLTEAAAGGWLKISRVRSSHCSVGSTFFSVESVGFSFRSPASSSPFSRSPMSISLGSSFTGVVGVAILESEKRVSLDFASLTWSTGSVKQYQSQKLPPNQFSQSFQAVSLSAGGGRLASLTQCGGAASAVTVHPHSH